MGAVAPVDTPVGSRASSRLIPRLPMIPFHAGVSRPRLRLCAGIFLAPLVFSLLPAPPASAAPAAPKPIAPIVAPFPMPQLQRPVFADRVFDIRSYGAVEGGSFKNTAAIARAVDACAAAGGGHILVPAGRWLTGPIHLKSHVDLHLAKGAVVVFSDRFADYLPVVLVRVGGVDLYNYSPLIYARDCTDVAVTGPGRLNGNGRAWWAWQRRQTREVVRLAPGGVPVEKRVFGTPEAAIRPNFVVFYHCSNVLLEGFSIGSGPCWTLQPVYCEDVIIRRLNVDTDGPNNDGLDPDSCRNVLIEKCRFSTGDDCVVLKSGYNEDGWRVNRPTENVVMRDCVGLRGHGGFVVGSEMSGGVRNVYVHDCEFVGTDRAVRIKSMRGRGGVVENLWVDGIVARDMKREAVTINMDYGSDPNAATNSRAPAFRNIHIRNFRCEGARVAVRIKGLADSPVRDLSFENVAIAADTGVICTHATGVSFKGVAFVAARGPGFDFRSVDGATIRDARVRAAAFIRVQGPETRGVVISGTPLDAPAPRIEWGPGADKGAVVVR